MKHTIFFLLFQFLPTYFASEIRLCGGLDLKNDKHSCTSWSHYFCPNSTFPAPDTVAPGTEQVELDGSLVHCEAGFHQLFLCDSREDSTQRFRICVGDFSKEVGGMDGRFTVKTLEGYRPVSMLKKSDSILGTRGKNREDAVCEISELVSQEPQILTGNISDSQYVWTGKELRTHGSREPTIDELTQTSNTYAVLPSKCELLYSEDGSLFSPYSSIFCDRKTMNWDDYYVLATSITNIVKKTGKFWFNIANYRDCLSTRTCKFTTWRSALPPICKSLLDCAKDRSELNCNNLDILSNLFVKEHLDSSFSSIWNETFSEKTLSMFIKNEVFILSETSTAAPSTKKKSSSKFKFKFQWQDPWLWSILGVLILLMFVGFIIVVPKPSCACCNFGDDPCDCFTPRVSMPGYSRHLIDKKRYNDFDRNLIYGETYQTLDSDSENGS